MTVRIHRASNCTWESLRARARNKREISYRFAQLPREVWKRSDIDLRIYLPAIDADLVAQHFSEAACGCGGPIQPQEPPKPAKLYLVASESPMRQPLELPFVGRAVQ